MDKKELFPEGPNVILSDYMLAIISELKSAGKWAAVHTYACTLRSFTSFSESFADSSLLVSDVFTAGRLKSYQNWLLCKKLSWNTISTYIRTLRAVANRVAVHDTTLNVKEVFGGVYTKVNSSVKRALSNEKLKSLLSIDLKAVPEELQRTLAYFKMMFLFRGMPFIDFAHLRKNDVKNRTITYCRHKTGKQITLQIPKEAVSLVERFSDKNSGSIYQFPVLDPNLQDDADIYRCYQRALRNFNRNLAKLASFFFPDTKLSSYTVRHTWATLCFHLGFPVGIISEALGHSSVRVTETYLKPFGRERIDKANRKLITFVMGDKFEKYMSM